MFSGSFTHGMPHLSKASESCETPQGLERYSILYARKLGAFQVGVTGGSHPWGSDKTAPAGRDPRETQNS